MSDCAKLEKILGQIGEEYTDRDRETIRRHIEECGLCRAQFDRMQWVAPIVREISLSDADPHLHPSDLQIAEFVERGCASENAEEMIAHLSQCRHCRQTASATWSVVFRDDGTPAVARAGSCLRWRRVLCGLGGILAFGGECLLIAIAVTQFALAWLIEPGGFDAAREVWPLRVLPDSVMWFWVLLAFSLAGAAVLRRLAARMFACAKRARTAAYDAPGTPWM